jgi:arsenate reductase-like glutaredoxin family protein
MQELQDAQQRELENSDPATHAFFRMEHKQQLEWAQEQKIDITIIDYLAAPYRKQCANRFDATLTERRINSKLMEFKKKLDPHRAK